MPTKKAKKLHYHHSRHANTREILMALIFGALVLLFLTLTIINVTSNNGTAYTYSTDAATNPTITSNPTNCIPTLVNPKNGTIQTSTAVSFQWAKNSSCSQPRFYHFNLWTADGTPAGKNVDIYPMPGTGVSMQASAFVPGKLYIWKVRSCDVVPTVPNASCRNPSAWSTQWTFWWKFKPSGSPSPSPSIFPTIILSGNPTLTPTRTPSNFPTPTLSTSCKPVLTTPQSGLVLTQAPLLSWNSTCQKYYQVNILGGGNDANYGPINTKTFQTYSNMFQYGKTYYWKVRTCDPVSFTTCINPGPWSNSNVFYWQVILNPSTMTPMPSYIIPSSTVTIVLPSATPSR